MRSRGCGLVRRIGAVGSATPLLRPSGGQAPALHFLIPPSTIGLRLGRIRRGRAGIEVDWWAHPGSESRTRFHSNRWCRQGPARQGMKNRTCGLVRRVGAADYATPQPDPSGGRAPALHFPIPAHPGFRESRGIPRHYGNHETSFSYQSLMPAGAGTPRYEKQGLWFGTADWHRGFCHTHPDPSGGQAPALHFLVPPSTIGLRLGRIRRGRAGIEVDWWAHPGSESRTRFHSNR